MTRRIPGSPPFGTCRSSSCGCRRTARRTPMDLARKAREGKERGFHGIKIKCALDDPNLERIRAVVDAVGPEFRITVDPNTRFYHPAHAIQLADALGDLRRAIAVFE